jgi:tRNA(fMet)-specific endonuclease VapC
LLYLLDTDHLSILQWGGDASRIVNARLSLIAPDDYGTTIVNYEEQVDGWLAEIARSRKAVELVEAYTQLNNSFRFFTNLSVWQFTEEAAMRFEALRKAKVRIGTRGLRIASIALVSDATVGTRNRRDFEKVPGLAVEDWTV